MIFLEALGGILVATVICVGILAIISAAEKLTRRRKESEDGTSEDKGS